MLRLLSFIMLITVSMPLCLATIVIVMLPLLFGRLVIKTEGYELIVSFGYLGWITKKFSVQEI
ncbi:hypothetical protein MUP37_02645, partial [Candidatus Bathyarchaeota archaeon]|nr:hypothetical protein [Candidatus Bathyarchaeota archaeon]